MVDHLSRSRLYRSGYTRPDVRKPIEKYRELYRDGASQLFKTERTPIHDCRESTVRVNHDNKLFDAWVFSHGLNHTCHSVEQLYVKDTTREKTGKRTPDKLLTTTSGNFNWPRGLAATSEGDLVVADTTNHRILVFNNFAVLKRKFGTRGSKEGQFMEPTGVAVQPNDDVIVADKKNKRIQVFSTEGKFKYMFSTVEEPHSISADGQLNIGVGTSQGSVELYFHEGKLMNRFRVSCKPKKTSVAGVPVNICMKETGNELVISDSFEKKIKFFSYSGELLYEFTPEANGEGLSTLPSGLTLSPIGQIIVADGLNHTVNLYSERGILLHQLVGPTDDVGNVQTCLVSPEGHLVVTEYSANAEHTMKIFRYRDCACHRFRPGSSKRSTPTRMV